MSSKWVSSSPPAAAAGGVGVGGCAFKEIVFFALTACCFFRGVETSRSSLALVFNRICRSKMLCLLFCFGGRLGFIGRCSIPENSQHNGKQHRHVDQASGLALPQISLSGHYSAGAEPLRRRKNGERSPLPSARCVSVRTA